MKKYRKNPSEPWLLLDQDERDMCCNGEDNGTAIQPEDCVEVWKQKLKCARRVMETAAAQYDKANKSYSKAASWKTKLEKWKEDAEDAHDKAIDVYQELGRFREAVDRTKAADTAKAVKAVLCLVKSIFDDVDDLLRVSSSIEESEGDCSNQGANIQELKQCIECDESLDANKKEKALSCIQPYEDQMKLVNELQADLLNKLLEILHSANLLVAAVEKTGTEEKGDISWQLEDLEDRISGKTTYTARERKCGGKVEASFEPPCESEIINPIKHYLPIRNSDYYCNIVDLYNEAEVNEEKSKKCLEIEEGKHNEAVAYYNSLNDAINAAEAAKTVK